ncbi:LPS export ABC transporter permease LptF [Phreatobacter oligotrophus]|uniref:Lipopolysaccharide export system permease protein n=1 Tax=Phreatobacter oligotrophus TaxID=1122261 RepID=A0A2T4ZIF7_9HYPH|nr:LPS export ABC transporter permease LptF [Phreatobacter oligotrophus]PTM61754.1 lipopolysaccharide export system permease protein [Phreatobacter oligotrophus]
MGSLERYIFRQAALAFVGGLFVLTLVVWITQVLRQLDLVTNSGQTIALFFLMTSLGIPVLLALIAPISLFIAVMQTLNKLNGDSELIVMSAAGVPPWRIAKPLLMLTAIVMVFVGSLSLWLTPSSIRYFRLLLTQVQANMLSAIVRPGQFTQADRGLTFHIRDRAQGGVLLGIVVSDTRDPQVHMTYVAERGVITEQPQGTFFVLETGNLQRRDMRDGATAIVVFDRYAFDLSQLTQAAETIYRPSERYTSELMSPNPADPMLERWRGRFRQELHDRFAAPLYPLAMMCIAFAMLGQARTTRQSRGAAIAGAIAIMAAVRGGGFAVSGLVAARPAAVPFVYLLPMATILFFGAVSLGWIRIRTPEALSRLSSELSDRLMRLVTPRTAGGGA